VPKILITRPLSGVGSHTFYVSLDTPTSKVAASQLMLTLSGRAITLERHQKLFGEN
jgi:hypothetical protein